MTAYSNGTYRHITPSTPENPAVETDGVIENNTIPAIGKDKAHKLTGKEVYIPLQKAIASTETTAEIPADLPAPLSSLARQIKALVQPVKDAYEAHNLAHTSAKLQAELTEAEAIYNKIVGDDNFDPATSTTFVDAKKAKLDAKKALENFVPVENPHAEILAELRSILGGKNKASSSTRTTSGEQSEWAKLPTETKKAVKEFAISQNNMNTSVVLAAVLAKFPELTSAIASAENKKLILVILNK